MIFREEDEEGREEGRGEGRVLVVALVLVVLAVEGGSGDNPLSSSYVLPFLVILDQREEDV